MDTVDRVDTAHYGTLWWRKTHYNVTVATVVAQCTVHIAQYTVHSAQYTVHSAHCTVHSAQYTVHSAQCTVHSAQCTVHNAQCTVHSALQWCGAPPGLWVTPSQDYGTDIYYGPIHSVAVLWAALLSSAI